LWYVYFLELRNGDIYVGSTDDLRRRFTSHQKGQVLSTRKYLPAVLRAYVAVLEEETARRLEHYFKSGSGKAFASKRFLGKESPNPELTGSRTESNQISEARKALIQPESARRLASLGGSEPRLKAPPRRRSSPRLL
jgi:putative endonuclease